MQAYTEDSLAVRVKGIWSTLSTLLVSLGETLTLKTFTLLCISWKNQSLHVFDPLTAFNYCFQWCVRFPGRGQGQQKGINSWLRSKGLREHWWDVGLGLGRKCSWQGWTERLLEVVEVEERPGCERSEAQRREENWILRHWHLPVTKCPLSTQEGRSDLISLGRIGSFLQVPMRIRKDHRECDCSFLFVFFPQQASIRTSWSPMSSQ